MLRTIFGVLRGSSLRRHNGAGVRRILAATAQDVANLPVDPCRIAGTGIDHVCPFLRFGI